ncbi:hypothetical protein B5F76_03885 [Desulfovibrio sp. An276]|uniref:hypothetical protein n=1 Tax=Desulfovibrio sp. An276 TaxID=1965618 RepID=UPI000B369FAE|nr:hypothetical protein [Desulfovibrio sp. An276]OUO54248.1 hypothetical protein B5F76_03885 [Desulfovibrio sp. An276]
MAKGLTKRTCPLFLTFFLQGYGLFFSLQKQHFFRKEKYEEEKYMFYLFLQLEFSQTTATKKEKFFICRMTTE